MAKESNSDARQLKAAILAAGQDTTSSGGQSLVLKKLGEHTVVEYVVQNALQVVPPGDVHVVVGGRQQEVRDRLGPKFHYIEQAQPRGTGDAVRQVCESIPDFDGNLLILYGDTPLFRPASIIGLLNRHRLRQAHLTVLTAIVDQPLPYGRIIRDAGGQIIDIIEDTEASAEVREIHELNVGAYVVNAR